MQPRDIPNLISIARILLVLPLCWLLLDQRYAWALVLYVVAALSDGLDGWLARRYAWRSRLGAILDPMGDKLMQLCAYLVLAGQGLLPWWLAALVLGRDVVIVIGAWLYHRLIGRYEIAAAPLSKLNTVLQMLLPVWLLAHTVYDLPGAGLTPWLIGLVACSTLISGLNYVLVWGRRAWGARKT